MLEDREFYFNANPIKEYRKDIDNRLASLRLNFRGYGVINNHPSICDEEFLSKLGSNLSELNKKLDAIKKISYNFDGFIRNYIQYKFGENVLYVKSDSVLRPILDRLLIKKLNITRDEYSKIKNEGIECSELDYIYHSNSNDYIRATELEDDVQRPYFLELGSKLGKIYQKYQNNLLGISTTLSIEEYDELRPLIRTNNSIKKLDLICASFHPKTLVRYDFNGELLVVRRNDDLQKMLNKLVHRGIDSEIEIIDILSNDSLDQKIKNEIKSIGYLQLAKRSFKSNEVNWDAVNGCAFSRKAGKPEYGLKRLEKFELKNKFILVKSKQLRSALLTTSGGAYRDLGEFDSALMLAVEGITITPKNFRPYTLAGAINVHLRNYNKASDYYEKAISLGHKPDSVKNDINRILAKLPRQEREQAKKNLLKFISRKKPDYSLRQHSIV
ncbi:tetratricopeptide repeat protein [Vibrio breoganii]|uniref:Tetratricopeptide repeat protein n=1 Tax=Vibrio breoganii TaxID=553239 RepID=A0ABX1UB91_9VIBR|nr:hypothetical protein [Vibrio breoganii]NMO75198.1 hypothetical protein [Vibrio breoganii]NMR71714.1 hypothetical protein [Vibrio breoganii]PMF97879.1 hypothetical protein BCV02_17830 [Vibrio breoganii]PMG91270.1 hypothetical protein BCU79_17430 [Vibrio breoganii]PML86542.1 hypothetical protein BCT67_13645 [Vibrio breoganii]